MLYFRKYQSLKKKKFLLSKSYQEDFIYAQTSGRVSQKIWKNNVSGGGKS
jgi:hypothetical protein